MRAGALAAAHPDGFEGVRIDPAHAEHAGLGLSFLVHRFDRDAFMIEVSDFSKCHGYPRLNDRSARAGFQTTRPYVGAPEAEAGGPASALVGHRLKPVPLRCKQAC